MSRYPNRPAFFAQRVMRLFIKTCAMQSLGQAAFALLAVIATQEDAKRYKSAVTFHNHQLMSLTDLKKWETLDATRRRLVEAGWLHYQPPPPGSRRQAGLYWTCIPDDIDDLPDCAIDEGDPIEAAYRQGYADAKSNKLPQLYPPQGDGDGYGDGYGCGYGRGEPSSPGPNPSAFY